MFCSCLLCATEDNKELFQKEGRRIVQCRNCGFIFVANPPSADELRKYYSQAYFTDGQKGSYSDEEDDFTPADNNSRRKLRELMRWKSGGLLYEVGCGAGAFLRQAQKYFTVGGSDLSDAAVKSVRKRLNMPQVQSGDFLELELPEATFDAVVMFDVLEHLKNPLRNLEKVNCLLRPGGILYITTPDIGSLLFRCQTKKWHLMTPTEHLSFFSSSTIRLLLEKTRFDIVKICHPGQSTNIGYIIRKFHRLYGSKVWIQIIGRLLRATRFDRLNIWLNLYDVMGVVARKR